ncbi:MAG: formylglycine-generating enzyme family protein [Parvularculaceae bacterium]
MQTDNAAVRVKILAAPANAAFAEKVALALGAEGYEIAAGEFDPKEVDAAIIVWSGASIGSPEIVKAAAAPLSCNALIPLSIGRIEAPAAFRHLEPVDFAGWNGDVLDERWRFVIDEIDRAAYAARLPPGAAALQSPPAAPTFRYPDETRRTGTRLLILASFGAMAAIVVGGFVMLAVTRQAPPSPAGVAAVEQPLVAASEAAGAVAEESEAPLVALASPVRAPVETATTPAEETATAAPAETTPLPAAPTVKPSADKLAALIAESIDSTADVAMGASQVIEQAPQEVLETPPAAPAPTRAPGEIFRDCPACPEMSVAPAGRFSFGAPQSEPLRQAAEGPVKEIEIKKPFAIGAREVTFAEWDACVADGGCNAEAAFDAGWGRGRRPAINVSWEDAQSYVRWLSAKTGGAYRLPTEEEWEYAARAGAETAFSFGPVVKPTQANFDAAHPYGGEPAEARNKTTPVGSYPKNAFGLYDMHGNVWEWVDDCWSANHAAAAGAARAEGCKARVLKGGAWNTGGWRLRAGHRIAKGATAREFDNGFRVVKELP